MRILLVFALLAPFAAGARAAEPAFVPGEILVRYRSTVTATAMAQHTKRSGMKKIRELKMARHRPLSLMKVASGESVNAAVARIGLDSEVELVQPNYIYKSSATVPNDTLYSKLWGLKNTAQTISSASVGPDAPTVPNNPGTSGKDMNMELAWDKITDCSSVIVAVVDTGIHYAHNDFAGNLWDASAAVPTASANHGWDFVNSDNNPDDDHGHGTHVAGTIGARGNNGAGITGVCWRVQLMGVKVLDATGSGTSATVAAGVDYAVANGAKVINLSLGSGANDPTLAASLEAARVANVVVVVAAGNDGTSNQVTPVYPCNYNKANMVCVAALDQAYSLASFSNYGATVVHVGAPGVNIVSTWPFTFSKTTDDFTTSWTTTGSASTTGFGPLTLSGPRYSMAVPNNWNNTTHTYINSADERTYKTFNVSGVYDVLKVEFSVLQNLVATGTDALKAYYRNTAADPVGGTLLGTYTGRTGGYAYGKSYDITTNCNNITTCTIGFQLTSDATNTDTGALIIDFALIKLTYAATGYNVIAGTSMATPHVAGLAAMLIAYQSNASYLATDVVAAIKGGGKTSTALAGLTSTGKSADAPGALAYIGAPKSVVLTTE